MIFNSDNKCMQYHKISSIITRLFKVYVCLQICHKSDSYLFVSGIIIYSFLISFSETVSMRDKEKQQDYRFLPEPNLPPLRLYDNETIPPVDSSQCINVDELRNSLPILPEGRRNELVSNYGLTLVNSHILVVS